MELRHLRYLVAIADAGAFSRAAQVLHVAQPALTRQIHDLERELNVELFDPAARKATLTPAGAACTRLARHVLHESERAVARARLSNHGVVGRCVLVCGPLPITTGLVAGFLARMRDRFPGITLSVLERVGPTQWDLLLSAEADIGLGVEPPTSYNQLVSATQFVHALDHVAVAPDHPLATRKSLKLRDLKSIPFLALDVPGPAMELARKALQAEMKRLRFPPGSISPREFSSIESVVSHVRAGQGWTIAPRGFAERLPGLAAIALEDFSAPILTQRIWRASENRPVILTVLDQLRQYHDNREGDAKKADTASAGDAPEFLSRRLEFRHLRTFLAVAEEGSIGRAAEVLDVTQPALSRQMRELEYDVGASLLARETRGVSLTAAGETFRGDVKRILSVADHIRQEARRAERARAQRCVVGTVPHPYIEALGDRVTADLESRPLRVRVGMRAVMSTQQAAALRACDIDIGLGHAFPVSDGDDLGGLTSIRLFDDRICTALLPVTHTLAAQPEIGLRDLESLPFLWVGRSFHPAFYDAVLEQFARARVRPRVEAEYEGLATLWSMAAAGHGFTLGWRSHLEKPPVGLKAVPLQDFNLPWGGAIMYRQDEWHAPVLAAIEAIVAHARVQFGNVDPTEAQLPSAHTSRVTIS